ncbi:MAG: hypothetical protein LBN24_09950 [Mediterranea sp.]|jgi:AraC-like DNA-binding protein|nr:hypothetical protein [Mediterranea sp.]
MIHHGGRRLQIKYSKAQLNVERWLLFLGLITQLQLFTVAIPIFTDRSQHIGWAYAGAILCVAQIITLTYGSIWKKHITLFYWTQSMLTVTKQCQTDTVPAPSETPTKSRNGILNKHDFEQLFFGQKLYTNPQISAIEMAERLQVGRQTLSTFIRTTYQSNFPQLLNQCRIAEMERIASLPSNADKSLETLAREAGFSSLRSYYRYKPLYQQPKDKGI